MKNNNQMYGFDYPQLDLSDDQQQRQEKNDKQPQGQPSKKIKIDSSIQKHNQTQKNVQTDKSKAPGSNVGMPFFPPPPPGAPSASSAKSWIPPPPTDSRSSTSPYQQQKPARQQQYHKPYYNNQNNNRDNRQKKNTVYVKNIPKLFNTQDKLMTFFKNEGIIKQIKVNDAQQSAVIRFLKEQQAAKFLKSNKFLFNRSFIVYGDKQNLTVTQQQIQDRIADEQGIVKKAEQTNLKVLKEKTINQLAQQIRVLYFFENYINQAQDQDTSNFTPYLFLGNIKNLIKNDLSSRMELKKALQNQTEDRARPQDQYMHQYNWTVIIKRQTSNIIQKKTLFPQFLKYGPIINLDLQYTVVKKAETQSEKPEGQQGSQNLYDYEIKLLFLSLKHLWCFYSSKKQYSELTIEGNKTRLIFDSGKLKTIQVAKPVQAEKEIGSQKISNQPQTKNKQSAQKQEYQKPTPINFTTQSLQTVSKESTNKSQE